MEVLHSVSRKVVDDLFKVVAKPRELFTVIGAKNTLDPNDPNYSPAYVSEQFATREEAEKNERECGYPLTEIQTDLDWVAPVWWHLLYATASK